MLLNIAGGRNLGLLEVNEAAEIIHGVAHPDANIIFGSVIDDALGDSVRVTVIAAGFDQYETAPTAELRSSERHISPRTADRTGRRLQARRDRPRHRRRRRFDVPSFLK